MPRNDNTQDDEQNGQEDEQQQKPSGNAVADQFKRRHRDRGDDEFGGIW